MFLVEQNAFHALKLAHRGYVMVNGLITMSGTGRELLERPEVKPPISKAAGSRSMTDGSPAELDPALFYEDGSFGIFLLVTVMLGGGAAALAGRAIAHDLAAVVAVVVYMLILGAAVRFLHFALVRRHAAVAALLRRRRRGLHGSRALLGFRAARAAQMVSQYRWINAAGRARCAGAARPS